MLSAFKNYITERWDILALNARATIQTEASSLANKWGNVFSTIMYVASYIVFVNVLFANVKTIGGYSKDEILLMTLFGQMSFYLAYAWSIENINSMVDSVNTGELDNLLTKPLPTLFYVSVKEFRILSILRDGLPALATLVYIIDWHSIHTTPLRVAAGIIVFFLGQISQHCYEFICALPVFWYEKGEQIRDVSVAFMDANRIPYDSYTGIFKFVLTTIIPVMLMSPVTASVVVGRSDPLIMLAVSAIVTVLFLLLKIKMWQVALRNYSSASS